MKAIFLDKDGTLINDIPNNVDVTLITLSPRAMKGLKLLHALGYKFFIVTNQSGIAKGIFNEQAVLNVKEHLDNLLRKEKIFIEDFYYCPHHPDGEVRQYAIHCECRKPQSGMLTRAAQEHGIDLQRSWMIGDILHDVEAGRRAGCRTVLVDNGNETEWDVSPLRTPDIVARDLYEAAIEIESQDLARHEIRKEMAAS